MTRKPSVTVFIAEDDQKEKGLKIAFTLQLKCLGRAQFFSVGTKSPAGTNKLIFPFVEMKQ